MLIQDIARYEGQQVTVKGWLYNKTHKGKLVFMQVRDGSGIAQCVVFLNDVPPEQFEAAKTLPQESSLIVTGNVRKDGRAPGLPGGYEISVSSLEVIQVAEEYPITPKEHGVEFLMDNRHLWLRSSRQWAIMRVRATIIRAIRDWLDDHGYLLVDTPILTPTAGENTTSLFSVDYFGEPAYLAQTGQLYNEANMAAHGKVYCFGPTFRAEKSKTRRHLMEFWMVEPEMAFFSLDDLIAMEQEFVTYIVQTVLARHGQELAILERDTTRLQNVTPPFPRITYTEAVERLQRLAAETTDPELRENLKIEWGEDFGAPHETAIAEMFDKPVFVTHYPVEAKAFYMEPNRENPRVVNCTDLLAPEGYGEITGGSERIFDPDLLAQRVKTMGISEEAYRWYIDLRRYGSVPHAGFGLGVERVVAWICGLPHIRETIPYPRMLNRKYP
ncbi:MAG: asparagine--tRNA ligase [Anaerolineae bacterium]|nr:asparagine--tRNA ligase [Anaerolineae bacterium]